MNFIITQATMGQNVPVDFLDDCHITLYVPRSAGYYGGAGRRWETRRRRRLLESGENYVVDFRGINAPRFALMITRGRETIARTNLITTDTYRDIRLTATRAHLMMPEGYLDNLPSARDLNNAIDSPKLNLLDVTYNNPVNGRLTISANAQARSRNNGNFKPVRIVFSFALNESSNPIWNDDTDDAYLVVHRPDLDLYIRNVFFYTLKPIIKGIFRPKIIKNINDSVNEIIATNRGLDLLENLSGAFTFNESPLLANRLRGVFLEKN